jgi:6-phosphogluconate dehydrogenase, decarboxylating
MALSDIGLIGLAVMGENLALNFESKGFQVSVYNRTVPGVEEGVVERFINGRGAGKKFVGETDIKEFVESLATPRKIFMMVRAGAPVDELIAQLTPLLSPGDILIDGGNSHFPDSNRRVKDLESKGLLFVGAGVSGGEEGALNGPSIMPGGSEKAWPEMKELFQAISAKADDGTPCCEWVGDEGAGHFVKMVHNGIEYGDMQLIADAYLLLKSLDGVDNERTAELFDLWNRGKLNSYLIEITAEILKHKDKDGSYLVDNILDAAGQKGTGKWSVVSSLDAGVPLNLIASAVYERNISALKEERVKAAAAYEEDKIEPGIYMGKLADDVHDALYAAKIVSYAQGFRLMKQAAKDFGWKLNYSHIARLWRGGCIIRSAFLQKISEAFVNNPELENLLLDPYFRFEIEQALPGWRRIVAAAAVNGVPVPAISSALNYFHSLTSAVLPANLIQAQRDYFGAHTFERVDAPRGQFFHENWTGKGGDTHSGNYKV